MAWFLLAFLTCEEDRQQQLLSDTKILAIASGDDVGYASPEDARGSRQPSRGHDSRKSAMAKLGLRVLCHANTNR